MYVLSIVRLPVEPAAFGWSTVCEAVTEKQYAADLAGDFLIAYNVRTIEAHTFSAALAHEMTGAQRVHTRTGLTFRIDTADQAPHPCPCCGRLVLPEDHAYARAEDAYCLGCFTWKRDVPQCLPENSAHTEEP